MIKALKLSDENVENVKLKKCLIAGEREWRDYPRLLNKLNTFYSMMSYKKEKNVKIFFKQRNVLRCPNTVAWFLKFINYFHKTSKEQKH